MSRVLEWVNQDRIEDHDSWMLFGDRAADTGGEMEALFKRSQPEDETNLQKLGEVQVDLGKVLDARRTSLERRPPTILGGDVLPADWRTKKEAPSLDVTEYLDARYASELVGKLDNIVDHAASLDPHDIDVSQIQDRGVRAYFEEAHRCYLYGFNAACAVMCRAILESALKARFDPNGRIEMNLPRGQSLVATLIEKSGLDDDLKKAAKQVKDGGDYAIHSYLRFQREYQSQGKVKENLVMTRSVLAQLYPQSADSEA